jgi:hypothetical protein
MRIFWLFGRFSSFCQILFDSVVMNLNLLPQFTIRFWPAVCFLKAAQNLDDERAHFRLEPIFLSTFSCFSHLLVVPLIVNFLYLSSLQYSTVSLSLLFGFMPATFWQLKNTCEFYVIEIWWGVFFKFKFVAAVAVVVTLNFSIQTLQEPLWKFYFPST